MQAAHVGEVYRSFLFFGLLASSALFFWYLALELSYRWYKEAWLWSQERVRLYQAARDPRRFRAKFLLFSSILPRKVGAVVHKEVHLFARDFSQWGQLVLILALVLFLHRTHAEFHLQRTRLAGARNMLAFFNVILLGFIQATLSLRYTFPSISLEGKAFWVVVSSGIGLHRFFFTKYYLHALVLLAIGLGMGGASQSHPGSRSHSEYDQSFCAVAVFLRIHQLVDGVGIGLS